MYLDSLAGGLVMSSLCSRRSRMWERCTICYHKSERATSSPNIREGNIIGGNIFNTVRKIFEMELGNIFKKCVAKGASRLMKFAVPSNCICSYIFLHLLDLSSIVYLSLVEPLAFDQINNCLFWYK